MVYQYTEDGEPDSPVRLGSTNWSPHGLPSGVLDSMWLQESGRGKNMLSSPAQKGTFRPCPTPRKSGG